MSRRGGIRAGDALRGGSRAHRNPPLPPVPPLPPFLAGPPLPSPPSLHILLSLPFFRFLFSRFSPLAPLLSSRSSLAPLLSLPSSRSLSSGSLFFSVLPTPQSAPPLFPLTPLRQLLQTTSNPEPCNLNPKVQQRARELKTRTRNTMLHASLNLLSGLSTSDKSFRRMLCGSESTMHLARSSALSDPTRALPGSSMAPDRPCLGAEESPGHSDPTDRPPSLSAECLTWIRCDSLFSLNNGSDPMQLIDRPPVLSEERPGLSLSNDSAHL